MPKNKNYQGKQDKHERRVQQRHANYNFHGLERLPHFEEIRADLAHVLINLEWGNLTTSQKLFMATLMLAMGVGVYKLVTAPENKPMSIVSESSLTARQSPSLFAPSSAIAEKIKVKVAIADSGFGSFQPTTEPEAYLEAINPCILPNLLVSCRAFQLQEARSEDYDFYKTQALIGIHGSAMRSVFDHAEDFSPLLHLIELETSGGTYICSLVKAVAYCQENNISIINLSSISHYGRRADTFLMPYSQKPIFNFFNYLEESSFLLLNTNLFKMRELIDTIKSYNGLIIAGAGNDRQSLSDYLILPQSFGGRGMLENLLVVMKADSPLSNYGFQIGLAVSGHEIPRHYDEMLKNHREELDPAWAHLLDTLKTLDGASYAAAYTSFTAARMIAKNPALQEHPLILRELLCSSATEWIRIPWKSDPVPILNVPRALQLAEEYTFSNDESNSLKFM